MTHSRRNYANQITDVLPAVLANLRSLYAHDINTSFGEVVFCQNHIGQKKFIAWRSLFDYVPMYNGSCCSLKFHVAYYM